MQLAGLLKVRPGWQAYSADFGEHIKALGTDPTALAHATAWVRIETLDRRTGELQLDAVVHPFDRLQTWIDPATAQAHTAAETTPGPAICA